MSFKLSHHVAHSYQSILLQPSALTHHRAPYQLMYLNPFQPILCYNSIHSTKECLASQLSNFLYQFRKLHNKLNWKLSKSYCRWHGTLAMIGLSLCLNLGLSLSMLIVGESLEGFSRVIGGKNPTCGMGKNENSREN